MRSILVLAIAFAGCTDDGPDSFGDDLADPQLPARGTGDARAWLAAGHYQSWRCEAAPHAGRPPSPHGRNRICNNDALRPGAGDFPVGAAAVKEIYDGSAIVGFAIARKLVAGASGDGWYWYEATPDKVYANSEGAANCTACHAGAARDFVFTVVP
jgi:hypothetical protein